MSYRQGGNELWTRDYDSFKFLEGNRSVGDYSDIADSIRDEGFVGSPIVVNEKMEIIDGQHRFLACKSIGAEFPFVVRPGTGIRECQILNEHGRNWTVKTYVESGVKLKDVNLERLNTLYEMYGKMYGKEVVTTVSKGCYTEQEYRKISSQIKSGEFVLDEGEYMTAIDVFEEMKPLIEDVEALGTTERRRLWLPLFFCHSLPEVNFKQFVKKFKKHYGKYLKGINQRERIFDALTAIYRQGKDTSEWIDFCAKSKEYKRKSAYA